MSTGPPVSTTDQTRNVFWTFANNDTANPGADDDFRPGFTAG